MSRILLTGSAGFIGYHLAKRLIEEGHSVVGIDSVNDYYDINLKLSRLENLGINKNNIDYNGLYKSEKYENFIFCKIKLEDLQNLKNLFDIHNFDIVCNLAAQAGVRYSLQNPHAYIDSNIVGFVNLLECCKSYNVKKFVYASSSSVYGNKQDIPFSEDSNVDFPISLYAASKKSNELIAHCYSSLFGIETIGLRFFTVYGPWGRPDMALFLFTDAILKGNSINVFNNGNLSRDFTYVDDICEGVFNILIKESKNKKKYKVYNIGNSKPVELMDFINEIENCLGIKAIKNFMPMQKGDVYTTFADTSKLELDYDYKPSTDIKEGVKLFIEWYKMYYKI